MTLPSLSASTVENFSASFGMRGLRFGEVDAAVGVGIGGFEALDAMFAHLLVTLLAGRVHLLARQLAVGVRVQLVETVAHPGRGGRRFGPRQVAVAVRVSGLPALLAPRLHVRVVCFALRGELFLFQPPVLVRIDGVEFFGEPRMRLRFIAADCTVRIRVELGHIVAVGIAPSGLCGSGGEQGNQGNQRSHGPYSDSMWE